MLFKTRNCVTPNSRRPERSENRDTQQGEHGPDHLRVVQVCRTTQKNPAPPRKETASLFMFTPPKLSLSHLYSHDPFWPTFLAHLSPLYWSSPKKLQPLQLGVLRRPQPGFLEAVVLFQGGLSRDLPLSQHINQPSPQGLPRTS